MRTPLPGSDKFMVVLVEDEALTRMVVCSALVDAGFDVVDLEHADAALVHLNQRSESVHAIVTDIHLPGTMNGLALAHHARRHWPWIVLLIASGLARPAPAELPEGARFLAKPYDPDHAVGHLREMLDGAPLRPGGDGGPAPAPPGRP